MSAVEALALRALRLADPERAHALALAALRAGLGPRGGPVTSDVLRVDLAGLRLPNPLGIAAGFDKNATAVAALLRAGPGFVEVGAATPRPQSGNPRPRLFRLSGDRAAINRFGFNNDGAAAIAARLAAPRPPGVVGLNLGANKASPDRVADYSQVLAVAGPFVDFATINVSSPNTERLRDLQGRTALARLLGEMRAANAALARPVPLFLKISPDLGDGELADVVAVTLEAELAGIVATNTTLAREALASRHRGEAGGLSGRPLRDRATRVLARVHVLSGGRLPLIGVGGIDSADAAYGRIRAGATALQLYTALVFGGMGLVGEILAGLEQGLRRDGFASVGEAVGIDAEAIDAAR